MNTTQCMKGWRPDEVEVRLLIQRLRRGKFYYFVFVRFIHTALYGVAYRGFADPDLYADREDLVDLLDPLSQNLCRMIDYWGWGVLLKDTKLSKLEILKAYETMRGIDWIVFPRNDSNVCGRYYRYDPHRGVVGTVPYRGKFSK